MNEKDCILVVDDDESTRMSLTLLLKRKGFKIELAGTGKEALAIAEKRTVNLTLLDIKLPDIDGIQLLAPLIKTNPDMAIIMITGFASVESAVQSLTAGASGYITKPIDLDDMLARIKNALDHQRLVTEVRQAGEALRTSEARFRELANSITDIYFAMDKDLRYTYWNKGTEELTGIPAQDAIGKSIFEILPDTPETRRAVEMYQDVLKTDHSLSFETEYNVKGKRLCFENNVYPTNHGIAVITKGITERKEVENEIRARNLDLESRVEERTSQLNQSLLEKETLLKEIHHRVKNNLQSIASLLNLQTEFVKDEKTIALIRESQNRIKAMALIHEKIYQSKSLDRIDYGDYLKKITQSLFESYSVSPKKITMKIHAKDIVLHIDKAIPCSLIINELVSNSFKHAFPNDRTGVVQIDVKLEGDTVHLLYSDNGVGLPESVALDRTESLGMRLIAGLTQQLKGTVEIQRGEGTTFVITFNV